ncbi:selenobiotic family peptide radical SAM maturase [Desulfonatronum thiosulfatophilum]|uniref:Selenobiotic family peptide radical SAM maturase n=1 Tax=Desulfonatronum thiosulfatophilum TaxID=617002 RepID=A0A1G6E813_9BACT|nr:thio(seleno)oxazole modification radical SAM maturase SbtM [Desulfonatronum thiosulfatophilum]SDB53624.1 selenobiotic family peptide radical SAM maturase [Desulfonatronum thiosulfatophilum]
MTDRETTLQDIFPACRRLVDSATWPLLTSNVDSHLEGEAAWDRFSEIVVSLAGTLNLPDYLGALAELEFALHRCARMRDLASLDVEKRQLNPSLRILESQWIGLPGVLASKHGQDPAIVPGCDVILVWFDPKRGKTRVQSADDATLTGLKIVSDGLHVGKAALEYRVPLSSLHQAVDKAISKGLVLAPKSRLRRNPAIFEAKEKHLQRFMTARVFTLQWHITQACDLHCRHCYDRSARDVMTLDQAIFVLDELEGFCRDRNVRAKVTFTGGNPLMYPDFDALYLETANRGFPVSILGNPTTRQRLENLLAVQRPTHYQVSLEGLREHNDHIRQAGYFDRVMKFMPLLKDLGIPSQVMLTLTRDNMDQVLQLGKLLSGVTDLFTFNRLSAVGEGAALLMPTPEEYEHFLRTFLQECSDNAVLGLKDNLINIIREEEGLKSFGGCTGFGCGAAFNFVTLLSDGEVHACRKFPSFLGNVFEQGLSRCYDSQAGQRYRAGSAGCRGCELLPSCGGCQAVASSLGLDPHIYRDPYCFRGQAGRRASASDISCSAPSDLK